MSWIKLKVDPVVNDDKPVAVGESAAIKKMVEAFKKQDKLEDIYSVFMGQLPEKELPLPMELVSMR